MGGAATVKEKTFWAAWGVEEESLAWTVKEYVPAVVGVPLSLPSAPSASPGGKSPPPETLLQPYAGVPPEAARGVL